MKALRLTLIILITLAAIIPAALGWFAERQLRSLIPSTENNPNAIVTLNHYQRGWLQSHATLHVRNANLDKILEITINHAPFYNAGANLMKAVTNNDTAIQGTLTATLSGDLHYHGYLPIITSHLNIARLSLDITKPLNHDTPLTLTASSAEANLYPNSKLINLRLQLHNSTENRQLTLQAEQYQEPSFKLNNLNLNNQIIAQNTEQDRLEQRFTADLNNPQFPDIRHLNLTLNTAPIDINHLHSLPELAIQIANNDLQINGELTASTVDNRNALTATLHLQEAIKNPLQFATFRSMNDILPYLNGSQLTINRHLPTPESIKKWEITHGQLRNNGKIVSVPK